jgi:Domain of unknown function (DUF4380)
MTNEVRNRQSSIDNHQFLIFLLGFFLFLSPVISNTAQSQSYVAKLERTEYRGWKVIRLTNGLVTLDVAPEIGGRAIQLSLGDQELFFVNKDLAGKVLSESENNLETGWANYGGDKVWPAPEGWTDDNQWPSVPYFVLDGSKFDAEVVANNSSEVAVRVTSPKDPRSGVQFVRTFHVYAGTTRVKVEQTMRNISRREVRWGIWHLVQNDAADANDPSKPNPDLYMYVPINPHSMFPEGFYNPYGNVRHPSYEVTDDGRMMRIHYLYRVGKVALDTNSGWYAVVNGQKNTCLVETFKYFSGLEYPDNATVESWNDGPGIISRGPFDQTLEDDPKKTPYFFESEALSPFATLEPGDDYTFTVQWSPTRAPNPIQNTTSVAAISEALSGNLSGSQVKLKGVFGVFIPGTLEAVFYSTQGEELSRENLGAVNPLEVVRLDKAISIPKGAFRVSVRLLDTSGENRGFLGNVILK